MRDEYEAEKEWICDLMGMEGKNEMQDLFIQLFEYVDSGVMDEEEIYTLVNQCMLEEDLYLRRN